MPSLPAAAADSGRRPQAAPSPAAAGFFIFKAYITITEKVTAKRKKPSPHASVRGEGFPFCPEHQIAIKPVVIGLPWSGC